MLGGGVSAYVENRTLHVLGSAAADAVRVWTKRGRVYVSGAPATFAAPPEDSGPLPVTVSALLVSDSAPVALAPASVSAPSRRAALSVNRVSALSPLREHAALRIYFVAQRLPKTGSNKLRHCRNYEPTGRAQAGYSRPPPYRLPLPWASQHGRGCGCARANASASRRT